MKRCTRRCSSVLIRDRSVHRQLVHRQRLNPTSRPSKPFPQRCPITIRSKTNHSAILRLLKTTAGPTSLLSTAGLLRSGLMETSGKHSVRSVVPMTARLCYIRSTAAAVLVPDTKLPHPPPPVPAHAGRAVSQFFFLLSLVPAILRSRMLQRSNIHIRVGHFPANAIVFPLLLSSRRVVRSSLLMSTFVCY